MRTGQVILRFRQWADWAGFFHHGMLQHVGREMKNLEPSAIYNASDFELLALFVDALQPATLVEALDQGLDSHRDAVDPSGRRPRDAVSRVDVQKEVLPLQPADSRALGQPFSPPMVACGRLEHQPRVPGSS